jgi:hypothetical protein
MYPKRAGCNELYYRTYLISLKTVAFLELQWVMKRNTVFKALKTGINL